MCQGRIPGLQRTDTEKDSPEFVKCVVTKKEQFDSLSPHSSSASCNDLVKRILTLGDLNSDEGLYSFAFRIASFNVGSKDFETGRHRT